MSKPSKPKKPARKQYTPEFRTEALAGRVGIPEAARQLGVALPYSRSTHNLGSRGKLPAQEALCARASSVSPRS